MQFIVRDTHDNEYGPLSVEEVEQYILDGTINADCTIRNSIINHWNKLGDVQQFADALEQYNSTHETEATKRGFFQKIGIGKEKEKEKESAPIIPKTTSFKNEVDPVPGGFWLRLVAGITDWVMMAIVAFILLVISYAGVYAIGYVQTQKGAAPLVEESAEKTENADGEATAAAEVAAPAPGQPLKDNLSAQSPPTDMDNMSQGYTFGSAWVDTATNIQYSCIKSSATGALWVKADVIEKLITGILIVFWAVVIIYFSVGYGVYAQTFGMWYWGLFICKPDLEQNEAYMFRCFVYTLLMLCFGILTPFVILFTRKKGIHDIIAGVGIFQISGQRV